MPAGSTHAPAVLSSHHLKAVRRLVEARIERDLAFLDLLDDEADRLSDRALDVWKEEALALVEIAPVAVAGLIALIDRFEEHTEGCLAGYEGDGLEQLLGHVRRFLPEGPA